jgi:tryptophan halogenase
MNNIQNITVVGAGTTGYLTVFHLCETYPDKKITWIYPEENNPIGVGEAIIPDVSRFLNNFGITHKDVLKNCNGTLKFGIKFKGWNTENEDFSFSFGYGSPNIKHNSASQTRIIETKKIPKKILEYSSISTHFRVTELLEYMEKIKEKYSNLTVIRKKVNLNDVKNSYDLIVDCTGFEKSVSYIPNNFKSITNKIPNNQVLLFRHSYTDREKQCVPYTVAEAMNYGWCFNIPLRNELACGYVHDNKFDIKDEFINYLQEKFNIEVNESNFKSLKMVTGRNEIHLKNNIVAVGLASCFVEPLESTGLWLVVDAVTKLCDYIDGKITEEEYNNYINNNFDAIVDWIVSHYKYSKRSNEYWDFYKNVPVKRNPIEIFPDSGWDVILSAFIPEVKRPVEPLDAKELIEIHKGEHFHEWILKEENYT